MKSAKKHSFYPITEVEVELRHIPRGKFSERVNDLLLKGLSLEKQQEVASAYQNYNSALALKPTKPSTSSFMSESAFTAEDETEDFV
ncbi:MAG: hypothetical protein ACOYOK_06805 [Pseudobdellovibrionaceae bacterium]